MDFKDLIEKKALQTARKYSYGDYHKEQEIYVACLEEAWAKKDKLDPNKNLNAFLSIIMKNTVYDMYKKSKPTVSMDIASNTASSFHIKMEDELNTQLKLNSLLGKLSDRDQSIIKGLSDGLTIAQIAELIGETRGNTATIIQRSRPKWETIYKNL